MDQKTTKVIKKKILFRIINLERESVGNYQQFYLGHYKYSFVSTRMNDMSLNLYCPHTGPLHVPRGHLSEQIIQSISNLEFMIISNRIQVYCNIYIYSNRPCLTFKLQAF